MNTKTASHNLPALDAFIVQKAKFEAAVLRLHKHARIDFDTRDGEINWGHVGDLEHYNQLLKQITDSCFHEGEHAESAK